MSSSKSTNTQQVRSIVILGGSYAGISIAHNILKHILPDLQKHGQYKVVLVSTSSEILCRPACPRAMLSDEMFDQEKLFVGIEQAFQQYRKEDFQFVRGTATELDHTARTVTVIVSGADERVIDFHAIVIATGASTPSPLLSLAGDAEDLRKSWRGFREHLKSAKNVVIAGGGPAGIETAAELGEYLHSRTQVTVVTAGQEILPVLRPALATKAERMLANLGVRIVKGVRVEKVDPQEAGTAAAPLSKASVTLSDGRVLDADLYIPATGLKPNTAFVSPALLTADGRVNTNASTLRVDDAGPRIYAVGDASSYARPAVHNILEAVPVLSKSMKLDLLLDAEGRQGDLSLPIPKSFKADDGETQLVPIGTKGGVGAMKGWKLPSWAVWLIKGRDYWLWATPRLWSGRQWEKEG